MFRGSDSVLHAYRELADTALERDSLKWVHLRTTNQPTRCGEKTMLKWGLVFFLLAIPSGVLGVVDTHVTTAVLAQVFFFGNVVLFVVFTFLGSMVIPPSGSSLKSAHRHEF